jgi:hypothetical protein
VVLVVEEDSRDVVLEGAVVPLEVTPLVGVEVAAALAAAAPCRAVVVVEDERVVAEEEVAMLLLLDLREEPRNFLRRECVDDI